MPVSRITSKGQITLPKPVRLALGVEPGDRVAFRIGEDGTVSIEPETVDLLALRASLHPKRQGVSVDRMSAVVRERGSGLKP